MTKDPSTSSIGWSARSTRCSTTPSPPYPVPHWDREPFTPPADIEETDDAYVIEIELPGIRREDSSIEVQGRRVGDLPPDATIARQNAIG